jgi:ribosomal protein S18 acetylase RimI-like enzyme
MLLPPSREPDRYRTVLNPARDGAIPINYVLLPIGTPRSGHRIERVAVAAPGGPEAGDQTGAVQQAGVQEAGAVQQAGVIEPGDLATQLRPLMTQLYNRPITLDAERLARVVANPANRLLLARDGGRILGTATVVLLETFRGPTAHVADVVVDEQARGRGVGAALTRAACDLAAEEGAQFAELTSRPVRTAAQRLYQSLGFELVETNVYRHHFDR